MGGCVAIHEILEARVGVTPEAPVVEHRHVHHVAIFQDDPVRRGAGAARHDGVHMVHIIGQVLIVAPELRHVHTSGATGHGKRVSAYRQLAAVQVLLLQHFDEQVQHRRLLARVRTGVFAQTVVIQIKILHRYRDIGQRFAAGAVFVLPVIRQGEINRDLAVVFTRGKRQRGDQAQHHHQRQQKREDSLFHRVIFLSLLYFSYLKRP